MHTADKGHHLHTLLFPMVKAVSLEWTWGRQWLSAVTRHGPSTSQTPSGLCTRLSHLDLEAKGLVILLLQSQHFPARRQGGRWSPGCTTTPLAPRVPGCPAQGLHPLGSHPSPEWGARGGGGHWPPAGGGLAEAHSFIGAVQQPQRTTDSQGPKFGPQLGASWVLGEDPAPPPQEPVTRLQLQRRPQLLLPAVVGPAHQM